MVRIETAKEESNGDFIVRFDDKIRTYILRAISSENAKEILNYELTSEKFYLNDFGKLYGHKILSVKEIDATMVTPFNNPFVHVEPWKDPPQLPFPF